MDNTDLKLAFTPEEISNTGMQCVMQIHETIIKSSCIGKESNHSSPTLNQSTAWQVLPEFLSLRFLNTEMITSRFPSTSTTVVKIKTLARIAMTQAGRSLPSVARVRSSCPSRGSVRFFISANVSGITGPQPELLPTTSCGLSPAGTLLGTGLS